MAETQPQALWDMDDFTALLDFAVSLLKPVGNRASLSSPSNSRRSSVSGRYALGFDNIAHVMDQFKRTEKPPLAYGGLEAGLPSGSALTPELNDRISFLLLGHSTDGSPPATQGTQQDAPEGEHGARLGDAASSSTGSSPSPSPAESLRMFVFDACSDLCVNCPIKVAVFAFRLFQRYLAACTPVVMLELCRQHGIATDHFPYYAFQECLSLAGNYLGEGDPSPCTVLTMHVQCTLEFDVMEVTPMDYCLLALESPLAVQVLPPNHGAAEELAVLFPRCVLIMFSAASLMSLSSSQVAALAFFHCIERVTGEAGTVAIAGALEGNELGGAVQLWRHACSCLLECQ